MFPFRVRLRRQPPAPLLAGSFTFLLFLAAFALCGIYPCGSDTIVWCDMEQQTVPLLMQLKALRLHRETISYSILSAGGMQFYGVFFFFLSNPLSLAALLTDIPADRLVCLLVICKLAASAATAAFWFRRRFPRLAPSFQILLGMMYGCCGYGMFYYQNLMWLDVMALLPLLLAAMHILLKEERALPFFWALSAAMLLSFYLCYMIVLYVLIYMTLSIHFTLPKKRRGAAALRFWRAAISAALLTAWVWLPCMLQVYHSARSGGIVSHLLQDPLLYHTGDKLCVISCTALGHAVLPELFRKDRPLNGKRLRDLWLFALLSAALLFDPVNTAWHTGSYQAFPLRWGMIPILLLLTYAAEILQAKKYLPADHPQKANGIILFLPAGAALTAFLLLRSFCGESLRSYTGTLWVSAKNAFLALGFALLCAAGYRFLLSRKHCTLRRLGAGLAALFFCEFAMNFYAYPAAAANPDLLFSQTTAAAGQITDAAEHPLSRVRMARKYAHANMLGAMGMPTLAHYTSLTRDDFLRTMKREGYSSYWMEVSSVGGTVLTDLLWDNRYLLGLRRDLPTWYTPIWKSSDTALTLAESSLSLPNSLYCDAEPEQLSALPDGSRAEVQQFLAAQLLSAGNIVTSYLPEHTAHLTLTQNPDGSVICAPEENLTEGQTAEVVYSIPVSSHQAFYFDLYSQTGTELYSPLTDAVTVKFNGWTVAENYPDKNQNGLLFLGEAQTRAVTVKIEVHQAFRCESFGVFGIDLDALESACAAAEGTALQYEHGCYTAQCRTDSPKTLVCSFAYDEGFSAEINGEPAEVFCVGGCRTAVQIPAGESTVKIRFHVQGLRAGLLIGAAGAVLILLRYIRKKSFLSGRLSLLLLDICFTFLFLFIYLLPVVLSLAGALLPHRT